MESSSLHDRWVPVIVTRLDDIPSFSEKVVVYLNTRYQDDYDKSRMHAILVSEGFSDIVVLREGSD